MTGSAFNSIQLINAGAGSGKTYRLTELIVQAIESGTPPEKIMATTFTVKAANELKIRIRQRLTDGGRGHDASRVEEAYIGTVHGLCNRLLSEYAIDSGLSPNLEILPESDADALFGAAVEQALSEHAPHVDPAARRLSVAGNSTGWKRRDWRQDVKDIVSLARSNGLNATAVKESGERSVRMLLQSLDSGDGYRAPAVTVDDLVAAAKRAREIVGAIPEPTKGTSDALSVVNTFLDTYQRDGWVRWSEWLTLANVKGTKESTALFEPMREAARNVLYSSDFRADLETVIRGAFGAAALALSMSDSYKQERGLIDFVDQQVLLLHALNQNPAVQEGVAERIDIVFVDEFQDTSPVQLSLFLRLHEIVGRSIWVGDPKQAIYGFRGTDSGLMIGVAGRLGATETLGYSWRSKKNLVDFTNSLFTDVFHQNPPDQVRLEIPPERKERATGGNLSVWYLDTTRKADDADAIAAGVADLLRRDNRVRPGDIAVLCRKNDTCKHVADALERRGIRASYSSGSLTGAREIQLVLAALRYLVDPTDTIALTEIIVLAPESWLTGQDPGRTPVKDLLSSPDQTLAGWRTEPIIQHIERLRESFSDTTPAEALDQIIGVLRIGDAADQWNRPSVRHANLEEARRLAEEYQELQRVTHMPATVSGLVDYIAGQEAGQAHGEGPDTCVVTTYHQAKGLEWRIVVMAELDASVRDGLVDVFGVHAVPAEEFDPTRPLHGRWLRYWPWPFDQKSTFQELDRLIGQTPEAARIAAEATNEAQRLLYVGMTRARDSLVLAVRNPASKGFTKPKDDWLQVLTDSSGTPLFGWPTEAGPARLSIGQDAHEVVVQVYGAEDLDRGQGEDSSAADTVIAPRKRVPVSFLDAPEYLPRRIVASGQLPVSGGGQATDDTVTRYRAEPVAQICTGIAYSGTSGGDPDGTDLGNAVHAVFAVVGPHVAGATDLTPRQVTAILERWGLSGPAGALVDADQVRAGAAALNDFLNQSYGDAVQYREWPVYMRNSRSQEMHGWIDLLVDTPDGWVIVDHKTHQGGDLAAVAAGYGPQLDLYRQAVAAASGKPVKETLLHFPMSGWIYRVETA